MEPRFKLQNHYWFDDVSQAMVASMIKRQNATILFLFINASNKKNKPKENNFKMPVKWVHKVTSRERTSIYRDVKYLVDEKILVKFDAGCYGWNLPGINNRWESIQKKPEPKRTEHKKETPERLVFNVQNPLEGFEDFLN